MKAVCTNNSNEDCQYYSYQPTLTKYENALKNSSSNNPLNEEEESLNISGKKKSISSNSSNCSETHVMLGSFGSFTEYGSYFCSWLSFPAILIGKNYLHGTYCLKNLVLGYIFNTYLASSSTILSYYNDRSLESVARYHN